MLRTDISRCLTVLWWVSCGRADGTPQARDTVPAPSPAPNVSTGSTARRGCDTLAEGVGRPLSITGIYSNLRVNEGSGDLGGTEIFIFPTRAGDVALIQIAEGQPGAAFLVPVIVRDTALTFTMPPASEFAAMGTFSGVVTQGRLRGRFANEDELDLPRTCSYWQ